MNALDFDTTLWMTGFVGCIAALAGMFIARSARGAIPSVSRMTLANCGLTLSVIGRVWVGDEMTNGHYAALWSLWAATLLALVSALRVSVDQPSSDRKLLLTWVGITSALAAAAALFTSPQPTAMVSCLALTTAAIAGCANAWKIERGPMATPRTVLIVAFSATALGPLWHLPLRFADFANGKAFIDQTAYTYIMFLGCWLSINVGLVMIQYARLIESTSSLAHTDQLTKLLNRHGLYASFRDFRRRHNKLMQGALIIIDIDHFKKINDEYGHTAGDAVLSNFARYLQRHTRSDDLLVRWGGEEFCLLLPRCTVEQASELAEGIRKSIADQEPPAGLDLGLTITASLGVTSLGANGARFKQDLRRGDDALYAAKQKGRNRVERWSHSNASAIHPYGDSLDEREVGLTL